MIEFKFEPLKQIIIHDLIHENLENFLYHCYTVSQTSAMWIDGIIIGIIESQSNLEIGFEKTVNGIQHYDKVIFVKCPKYTKSLKWNGGNYEILLQNDTNFPELKALAKWIKSQPVWKTTPEKTV